MKIVSIDYGKARIGMARSDALGMLASPIGTVHEKNFRIQLEKVAEIIAYEKAEKVLYGLPLNMDGTEGARAATAHAFGDMLLKLSDGYIKAVHYCDERLSTVEAHDILSFSNVHSKKRKKVIDTLSAELILQYFLDEKRKTK